jgi:DnaJ-class molecular chaperone
MGAGAGFRAGPGAEGGPWSGGTEFHFENAEDLSDVFEQFFSGRTRGGASSRGFDRPGSDLETTVRIRLRDVLTGVSRRIELAEQVPCPDCRGTGRQGNKTCGTCAGTGARTERRTIDVKIPAGVRDGTRVRVSGKGAPGSNHGRRGDLYLKIEIEPDRVFRVHGDDLHVTLPVWPWEAALGAEVLAPTLADTVRVKVPPGSNSGKKLRLRGKGLPTESGGRGDLLFVLQHAVPTPLTEEERRLYEELGRLRKEDPRTALLNEARKG